MIKFNSFLAAAAAMSLAAAPALAADRGSVRPVAAVAAAQDDADDGEGGAGNGVVIALGVAAVALGIYVAVDGGDDETPNSP